MQVSYEYAKLSATASCTMVYHHQTFLINLGNWGGGDIASFSASNPGNISSGSDVCYYGFMLYGRSHSYSHHS